MIVPLQKNNYLTYTNKQKSTDMKFALLTVTYGGLFYKGQALSLEQQIHRAK
jgi:hypothetical protein